MRILITTPSFALHGGIRIILQIANRLSNYHDVTLYSLEGKDNLSYWNMSPRVRIVVKEPELINYDCLFIMSPHAYYLTKKDNCPKKVFLHLQMMENFFRNDQLWHQTCFEMYKSAYPMFVLTDWVRRDLHSKHRRTGETIIIGNGVDTKDFPVEKNPKRDHRSILVEGWESYNPAKDQMRIAPKVAARLREYGYKIIAYGQVPLSSYQHAVDEYHFCPSLEKINELYSTATVLMKASRYDCRACAPVEAMTKGLVTCRAIIEGDPDLTHNVNAIRVNYAEQSLFVAMLELLVNHNLRDRLSKKCYEHIETECNWDKWIKIIRERIERDD